MKLILQRKEAINKKKTTINKNDETSELRREKLDRLLKIEENTRKYVVEETNINRLWDAFERYKNEHEPNVDV